MAQMLPREATKSERERMFVSQFGEKEGDCACIVYFHSWNMMEKRYTKEEVLIAQKEIIYNSKVKRAETERTSFTSYNN